MKRLSLLLASGSPRRIDLLGAAGFQFESRAPGVAERNDSHLTARELTAWNAVRKGLTAARQRPNDVVLAADTVVALNDEIIGKPIDFSDAIRILRRLSGQTHHVFSSVFVVHLAAGKARLFCEISHVRFRKLNDGQIRAYLAKIEPLDKAGAYAAQGHGAEIIASIDGSYSNVVGLPMERTVAMLKEFGVRPQQRVTRPSPSRARWRRARASGRAAIPGKETKR